MINEMAGLIQLSNDFVVPVGLFLNIKYFATGDIPKKVNIASTVFGFC